MKVMDLAARGGRGRDRAHRRAADAGASAMSDAYEQPALTRWTTRGRPCPSWTRRSRWAQEASRSCTRTTPPSPAHSGRDVGHQHHAPHRRDAGAAHHLHGGDAARAEGARHRAAPGPAQQPEQPQPQRTPTRWCWRSRSHGAYHREQEPGRRTWKSSTTRLRDIFQTRSDKTIFVRADGQGPLRPGGRGHGRRQGRGRRAHRHHLREDDRATPAARSAASRSRSGAAAPRPSEAPAQS